MSDEQSWGADTVAFGRAGEATPTEPPPRRRAPRGPGRGLPRPAGRTMALAAVAIVGVVALIAVLDGESGSPAAPIREVVDPAPRVVVKSPTPPRRRGHRPDRRPDLKRQPKGQIEGGKREPKKTSPTTHEQAAPEPEPAPAAEAEPEPIVEPEPEPIVVPAPAPRKPTSPAAEFGL